MGVIEVGLLTGYSANTDSLDKVSWKGERTNKPLAFYRYVNH